eukprot:1185083-Prorocentrum_minimum.AAC.1
MNQNPYVGFCSTGTPFWFSVGTYCVHPARVPRSRHADRVSASRTLAAQFANGNSRVNALVGFSEEPKVQSVTRTRGCIDKHENCQNWASSGECTNNPSFMEAFTHVTVANDARLAPALRIRFGHGRSNQHSQISFVMEQHRPWWPSKRNGGAYLTLTLLFEHSRCEETPGACKRVFFDISIDGAPAGRVVMDLFHSV